MSAFSALTSTLESAVKDGQLTLDNSLLDATLLAPFPNNLLPLDNVEVTLSTKNFVLSGDLKSSWKPAGLEQLELVQLSLTLTVTDVSGNPEFSFSFQGQVMVGTKTIELAGEVASGKLQFSFVNSQNVPFSALASLVSNNSLDSVVPSLTFLNSVSIDQFSLSFSNETNSTTEISVQVSASKAWKIIGDTLVVESLQARLNVSYTSGTGGRRFAYEGEISGLINAGAGFQVQVPFKQATQLQLAVTATKADAATGLPDIAGLIGGTELKATIKKSLTAIKLTELAIDQLTIDFDPATKKPTGMIANGHLVFASTRADVRVEIPGGKKATTGGWSINVNTAEGEQLPVGQLVDDLVQRFGSVDLPEVLASVKISNLTLAANTGSQSLAVGFETAIALSANDNLTTQVSVAVEKSGSKFTKTFSGILHFNDLLFELDFTSGDSTTEFTAVYDASREGSSATFAGSSATGLADALRAVFPPALGKAIPASLDSLLNLVKVSDNQITLGAVGEISFDKIRLNYRKTGKTSAWTIGFVGGITLTDLLDLQGTLQVEIGENNELSFVADADSGTLPKLPLPLPVTGKAPYIQGRLQQVMFAKSTSGLEFSGSVAIQLVGFTGILDDILPDETEAVLTLKNKVQTLTVTKLTEGIEIPLPAIPVPGSKDVELGKVMVNISDFSLTTGTDAGVSLNLDLGLPSKLNNLFGTQGGKPLLELFNTYDPADPEGSVLKVKVGSDGSQLSATLMSSPFKAVTSVVRDGKAWWDIDLGAFGAAEVMVPEFSYTAGSTGLKAAGGFNITRPLALPLTPLKWFLTAALGKEAGDIVPDSVPIKSINILDKQDNLNIDGFKKLWGSSFPSELEDVIDVLDNGIHKLPDRLKDYFNFVIPDSLLFDIQIDSSGGIQGGLSVGPNDPPIRILYPGMAGPLPALNGLELRRIAFGEILSGQLFTLEIDATFDQFNLLTIAASLILPDADIKILPQSETLQSTLELKNLFAVIFYQAGIPIPIPLFYDQIGIDYLGFEGVGVGSHFSLPKPTLNVAELSGILGQFVEFFSDSSYLLDASNPPKQSDIRFTIGGNYLQLPEYTGGKLLGKKTVIQEISAWKLLAHALNWLKTFSVNEFVQSFPLEHRVGSESVSLFNIASINVAWAITTPNEFTEVAYKKLNLKDADKEGVLAVLPQETGAHDEGLVLLMRGGFDIARIVSFESTIGLMGSSGEGFATGFQLKGQLAGVVDADLSGAVALNPKGQPAFQLLGKAHLGILQQTVMDGELYVSNQQLMISGHLDLFPGIKAIDASANIEGKISNKELSLNGDMTLAFGAGSKKVTIISGQVLLSQSEFYVSGKFLAIETQLHIITKSGDIGISGSLSVSPKLSVSTGPIRIAGVKVADGLSFNIAASLKMSVEVWEDAFTLGVAASFTLQGKDFNVGVTLHVVPSKLADVTKEVIEEIVDNIEEYFRTLYKDAAAWAAGVAKGAIQLAENTAKNAAAVFKNVYKTSAKEATALLKSAEHAVEDIGGALNTVYDQTEDEVASLLKGAGYAAEEVGKALEKAFNATAKEAAKILQGAGYAAEEVGEALESVFNTSAAEVTKLLKSIGYTADQVGKALSKAYGKTAADAAKLLKSVGYSAQDVGKAMQSAYKQSAQQAAKLLKGAGFAVTQVSAALKSVFKSSANQTAKILKGAGYAANDVGKALKSAFNSSSKAAASALKAAGYSANQVGAALKSGFAAGANEAAKALKSAGFAANQVGGALKGTFTNSASAAASALKSAGFSANQAASVMKNTFNASANDVAKALKSTFGLGGKAVEGVLKNVKFSTSAINKVLKDVFNIIPFVKIPHIKHVKIPHVKIF